MSAEARRSGETRLNLNASEAILGHLQSLTRVWLDRMRTPGAHEQASTLAEPYGLLIDMAEDNARVIPAVAGADLLHVAKRVMRNETEEGIPPMSLSLQIRLFERIFEVSKRITLPPGEKTMGRLLERWEEGMNGLPTAESRLPARIGYLRANAGDFENNQEFGEVSGQFFEDVDDFLFLLGRKESIGTDTVQLLADTYDFARSTGTVSVEERVIAAADNLLRTDAMSRMSLRGITTLLRFLEQDTVQIADKRERIADWSAQFFQAADPWKWLGEMAYEVTGRGPNHLYTGEDPSGKPIDPSPFIDGKSVNEQSFATWICDMLQVKPLPAWSIPEEFKAEFMRVYALFRRRSMVMPYVCQFFLATGDTDRALSFFERIDNFFPSKEALWRFQSHHAISDTPELWKRALEHFKQQWASAVPAADISHAVQDGYEYYVRKHVGTIKDPDAVVLNVQVITQLQNVTPASAHFVSLAKRDDKADLPYIVAQSIVHNWKSDLATCDPETFQSANGMPFEDIQIILRTILDWTLAHEQS